MKKGVKISNLKKLQQSVIKWQESHQNIDSLRKTYRAKVLDWVVKSMEFEKEPVDVNRLKKLLKKEKMVPDR